MRPIDLQRPFDYALVVQASHNIHIKGLFFRDFCQALNNAGQPWPTRFVGFKDYTGEEFARIVSRVIEVCHPGKPLREAMHQISASQYPALRDSIIGRVIFGVLGNDVQSVFRLAAKGYAIASNAGPVKVAEVTPTSARAHLFSQSMPLEGWHTGVWEGAVRATGHTVKRMGIALDDEFNGVLEIEW